MAAKWQEDRIESGLKNAFGPEPTQEQLWALVSFAKHCRLRCRSNAALNNFMGRIFSHASFKQVPKIDKDGGEYQGLEIGIK